MFNHQTLAPYLTNLFEDLHSAALNIVERKRLGKTKETVLEHEVNLSAGLYRNKCKRRLEEFFPDCPPPKLWNLIRICVRIQNGTLGKISTYFSLLLQVKSPSYTFENSI